MLITSTHTACLASSSCRFDCANAFFIDRIDYKRIKRRGSSLGITEREIFHSTSCSRSAGRCSSSANRFHGAVTGSYSVTVKPVTVEEEGEELRV